MVRIFKVNDLADRKRLLIVQSNIHRQTLKLQVAAAQESFADIKSRFVGLEISTLAFKSVADIVGMFLPGAQSRQGSGGFMSKVITGIKFFNQVKGFFGRRKSSAEEA
jgi:hypothetical protein